MSISVRKRLALVAVGLSIAALAAACPGTLEDKECFDENACCDVPGTLVAQKCATANCHDSITKFAELDLTNDPGLNARLLNVPGTGCTNGLLVDGAAPENSLLYTKCLKSNTCQSIMPFNLEELNSKQLECLLGWIREVAGQPPTSGAGTGSTGAGSTTTM